MSEPLRWAIAGPGRMAAAFAEDFVHVPDAELVAVGSRSADRAADFAGRFGIPRAHGSYAELMADDEVDVVYIATPHPQHKALALAAIEAGKAVLVEKAFAASLDGAREIVEAARARGVFCMEAMWTRFNPVVKALHEMVAAGELGELIGVQGDLFAHRDFDAADRLFAPELGGGATLDLGVYVLHFAQDLLGAPETLAVDGILYDNGVDAQASYLLGFTDGAQASLSCGFRGPGPGRMAVVGTKGWVEVGPRFHHPRQLDVHIGDEHRVLTPQVLGQGYAHEVIEVNDCLRKGLTEHPLMPLDLTLEVQASMQEALDVLGVRYDED